MFDTRHTQTLARIGLAGMDMPARFVDGAGVWDSATREFRDFPAADLPALVPVGFEDSSWHNEGAPSLAMQGTDGDSGFQIFCDRADPAERSDVGIPRYGVLCYSAGEVVEILSTDEWPEVLALFDMPESFESLISAPISDKAGVLRFCSGLSWFGRSFHFEDSPESIVSGATLRDAFTPSECEALRARVGEAYAAMKGAGGICPIAFTLITDAGFQRAMRGGYD